MEGYVLERRQFLGALAGMTAGGAWNSESRERIVIIGGGIVGASICYRLAKRGADVTLVERHGPAAGATGRSFAWINASFTKQPRHYHNLNRLGVHAFRDLHRELGPELPASWGGTIEWYTNPERADELRRMAGLQQEWGYPIRMINDQEIARMEPALNPGKLLAGAFSEIEGQVDAAGATRLLLRRAQQAGARIVYPCEVGEIVAREGGYLLRTSRGELNCRTLVLASGVDTERLAAMAGVKAPLVPAPGITVRTTPQVISIRSVLVTEDSHLRRDLDGRFVIGDDFGPPENTIHQHLKDHPRDFPDRSYARIHGERIRAGAAKFLPGLGGAGIEKVSICWRPMPKDGFPIVGFVTGAERLYLAVTHSGVTLGPLIGQLAALEILDGAKVDLLSNYRPGRFNL